MNVIQQDASSEVVDVTLTDAIGKAVDEHQAEAPSVGVEEVEKPTKKEDQESGDEAPEEDPAEIEQGKVLIRALKNPDQASFVIDYLARQAGYTKQTVETKQDVVEAKKDIESILKETLGDEFGFLAPKLGPAIKASLEALLKDRDMGSETRDLRARIEKQELKEIQQETARVHVELAQEWFGTDDMPANVVKALSSAMDDFPPSDPKMGADKYYRKIFSLVAGELELTKAGKKSAASEKSARNRNDGVARNLSTQQRGVTPSVDGSNPRKLSLKDAVSLAIEQVDQASKK